MKALFAHGAHDLRLEDCNAVAPGPGEVALRMRRGGICGSDLHYYHNGGFGTVKLREPMILGHEVAGEITALGDGVEGLAVGDLVAVSPSRPCVAPPERPKRLSPPAHAPSWQRGVPPLPVFAATDWVRRRYGF